MLGVFVETTELIAFPESNIKTVSYPINESLIMDTQITNKETTIVEIDKILLLHCALSDTDTSTIAERLYLDEDKVKDIIESYKKQKHTISYLGYQNKTDISVL